MKLMLLCHAATAAMRTGGFPATDDALDDGSMRRSPGTTPTADVVVTSPALAAREMAQRLGLDAAPTPALADLDYASWSGRSFEKVAADDPAAFAEWLAAPWLGTPGGETFAAAVARVAAWTDAIDPAAASVLAVVSPMIVRAMLAATIEVTAAAAMRIDVVPLTITTLSRHRGWRLQRLGAPLG